MKFRPRSRRRKEADFRIPLSILISCGLFFCAHIASAQPLLPSLRPPRPEINATFWEKHGWQTIIASTVLTTFVVMMVYLLTRPKPKRPESAEARARRSLEALRGRVTDGALLMEVSRIFRRYVIYAFDLPAQEMTTAELRETLPTRPQSDPALAIAIDDFLRQCDEDKFSLRSAPPNSDAASRALELLEQIENHRLQSLVLEEQPAS